MSLKILRTRFLVPQSRICGPSVAVGPSSGCRTYASRPWRREFDYEAALQKIENRTANRFWFLALKKGYFFIPPVVEDMMDAPGKMARSMADRVQRALTTPKRESKAAEPEKASAAAVVEKAPPVMGFDLGLSNACVAYLEGGESRIIENQEGMRTTPSVVAFLESGEQLVGIAAKRQAVTNPEVTVFQSKRLIGRRFDDPVVQQMQQRVPYKIVATADGDVAIETHGNQHTPSECATSLFTKLKDSVESYLGNSMNQAVIAVPANFTEAQRSATKAAAEKAGLEVTNMVPEPVAAALAYGLQNQENEGKSVAVFDLGGGTFDFSILKLQAGVLEVMTSKNDMFLGGDDVDRELVDWLLAEFHKETKLDLTKDKLAMQRLREAAERAKIELSTALQSEINLPFITADATGPKHLMRMLTRAKFEALMDKHLARTQPPIEAALKDVGMQASDIHDIVLVGGMTRMPKVEAHIEKLFGKKPNKSISPDEVVAMGAALQGGVLKKSTKESELEKYAYGWTPLSVGIETLGGMFTRVIPRGTNLPALSKQTFTTSADYQTEMEFKVVLGERELAADNRVLANFVVEIEPARRGDVQIELTVGMDVFSRVTVKAIDKRSRKTTRVKVRVYDEETKEEDLEKIATEAEQRKLEDQKHVEFIVTKNTVDAFILDCQHSLSDFKADILEEDFDKYAAAINTAREKASTGSNIGDLYTVVRELQAVGSEVFARVEKTHVHKNHWRIRPDID